MYLEADDEASLCILGALVLVDTTIFSLLYYLILLVTVVVDLRSFRVALGYDSDIQLLIVTSLFALVSLKV